MSDEFYGGGGNRRSRGRRSLPVFLLDLVLTLASAAVAAAMLLTLLVPYIDPARVWFFPVLGLAAPAIYVATVLAALYWILRWRWLRASVMLGLVAVGLLNVSLFYKPRFRRDYGEVSFDRGAFKVMTYNVRGFYGENGRSSVDSVLRLIAAIEPDVVCIQEFNARLADGSPEFERLGETYESAVYGRTQAPDSTHAAPLVILSKYRIIRSGTVLAPREAVWADVKMGDDTVRIFNNHLRSTAINAADDAYLTNRDFLRDTAREDKLRSIVTRYRDNSVLRAAQVDSIARVIAATPYRKIVCGDFNDTPMSYVYRTMADGLTDAFRAAGAGYSHTFRGFFNTLRIDYVLSSEGFETLSYEVPTVEYSDHLPVVARLLITARDT